MKNSSKPATKALNKQIKNEKELTNKDIINNLSKDTNIECNINSYINKNPIILENSESLISSSMDKIKNDLYLRESLKFYAEMLGFKES